MVSKSRVPIEAVRIDLRRTHLAVIEVDRAGEVKAPLRRTVAKHVDRADDPIVAARLIVQTSLTELHCPTAKAFQSLVTYRVFANVDGLLRGEAVQHAADHTAETAPIAVGISHPAGRRSRITVITASPCQIERVADRT